MSTAIYSREQIVQYPGYVADAPVSLETFGMMLEVYRVPDAERVECCFQKPNGRQCRRRHGYGFFALRKDKVVTLIGNECAMKPGGDSADAERLRGDRKRLLNELQLRSKADSVDTLLVQRDGHIAEAQALIEAFAEQSQTLSELRTALGEAAFRRLGAMAKTGNSTIVIEAIKRRPYEDDDGRPRIEKTRAPHPIGRISGVRFFDSDAQGRAIVALRGLRDVYDRAASTRQDPGQQSIGALNKIFAQLSTLDALLQQARELLEDREQFGRTDPLLFCYLASDRAERYKLARYAIRLLNLDIGRDDAKRWLADQDAALARRFDAHEIAF